MTDQTTPGPMSDEQAAALLAPLEARARALRAAADAKLRAAVLREAADAVDSGKAPFPNDVKNGASWAARMLRRMADETQPAETPWPTVTDFSIEVWEGDTWVGVTYKRKTLEDARERRDSFRRRFPEERLRIVRWDETSTVVEADPEPAASAHQHEPDHVCNSVVARGEMDEPLGYQICGICGTQKSGTQA